MSKRTEDDSRRNSIRNWNRERARGWMHAAELTRVARALVLAIVLASGLTACGAGGITGPPEPTSRKFVLADPTGTTPTTHTLGGDEDDDDDDDDDNRIESRVWFEDVETNCRNGEQVPVRGWAYFSFEVDGLRTEQLMVTRYVVDGKGTFGNVYYGGGGHSEYFKTSPFGSTIAIQDKVVLVSRTAPDMYFFMTLYVKIDAYGRMVAHVEKTKTNCDDLRA
jgi:hypothetical protein